MYDDTPNHSASRQRLAFASISEVSALIASREVSPVEIVELMLERTHELNPEMNAFYTVFADEVMAEAKTAEEEIARGTYRGPLHGIPIGVKDIFETGPTTCGSEALRDYVAPQDCTSVAKLKVAGALVLGKTATYEFAAGVPALKTYFKPTRNPWNLDRDASGSSSGSAAAVAAGMVYAAMGTCSGGSIRYPAMSCLIVGLKPTYGRVSRAGIYPLCWSFDHPGPLARTVKDAANMLQACAGYDPLDPASAPVPVPDFTSRIGQEIEGIRIGLPRSLYEQTCDRKVLDVFHDALAVYEQLGAQLVEVQSRSLEEQLAMFWSITCAEISAVHANNVRKQGDLYTRRQRQHVMLGLLIGGTQYLMANRLRAEMRDELLDELSTKSDVLVLPTAGFQSAPPIEEDPAGLNSLAFGAARYAPLFNATGLPAIQVPCGFDSDRLPVGFQVAAKPFDEVTMLQVAHAYEQAAGWHRYHPLTELEGA